MLRRQLPSRRALALAALAAAIARASGDVCALVPEGTAAALACPPGQVITGVPFAIFGTFAAGSSCAAGTDTLP